jgi:hypothetical protein
MGRQLGVRNIIGGTEITKGGSSVQDIELWTTSWTAAEVFQATGCSIDDHEII